MESVVESAIMDEVFKNLDHRIWPSPNHLFPLVGT